MGTVLITGANRGLGVEFCRQYADKGWHVIVCCRYPDKAEKLIDLQKNFPQIAIEALDVTNFEQIENLATKYRDTPIDILINNAGIYADNNGNVFGKLNYEAWQDSFLINTLAPMKMAECFFSSISKSKKKLIVNITSLMGSIADNGSGGSMLYRTSKSALNSAMKNLALDLKHQDVGILILHPGWVRTDMGGPNGLIDSKESVSGMCEQIQNFTMAKTGMFINYNGKPLPW